MNDTPYHIPALLNESIDALNIREDGIYIDVTFGGGGHSKAILSRLSNKGKLFSFDQDIDAYNNINNDPSNKVFLQSNNWQFVHGNFRYLANFMDYYGIAHIDGLIADLGVSFHHFDTAQRGFSFRFPAALDMRMNNTAGKTAADIINTYNEEQISNIFYLYGELRQARRIAHLICKQREQQPILTTEQLSSVLQPLLGHDKEKKDLVRLFQALRIEVNDELQALREMLNAASQLLKGGGRIAVLTYHSLEDRLVKNFLKSGNFDGKIEKDFYGNILADWQLINNKVITASQQEIERNPRSRSAKLRAAYRK